MMFLALLGAVIASDCSNCQSYAQDIVMKHIAGWDLDKITEYYENKFKPLPKPLRPKYIKDLIKAVHEDFKDHKLTVPLIVCVQLKQCSVFANKNVLRKAERPKLMPRIPNARIQQQ